ncbi:hypothetical protein ACN47E_004199 [Coniothyrium glycines]
MNPHISLPRPTGGPSTFGSTTPSRRKNEIRMPRFFKRLFKFPQMDFEMAVWEIMSLIIAPKKVFRQIYYHKQTTKTYHRPDPSFTYLLSLFLTLTSLAWGFAYADGFTQTLHVALVFLFGHLLLLSLVIATLFFFLVGKLLGPGSSLPGRRRGLYNLGEQSGNEELEFGYCWDVAIRAFVPVWLFLYALQFLCMPLVGTQHWVSLLLSNTLYLVALNYYFIITFLGYNALPFLHHTELLLVPIAVTTILWFASLFGFNMSKHFAPVLWAGARLRKQV